MKLITCDDSNNNAQFLMNLIRETKYFENSNYYWVLSDIELIPLFHGDYNGSGGAISEETAYNFLKKYENNKIGIMKYNELIQLLEDTRTVTNGVFVCFDNRNLINKETFRPTVECKNPERICHYNAELEVRILDGDLFYVLENRQ